MTNKEIAKYDAETFVMDVSIECKNKKEMFAYLVYFRDYITQHIIQMRKEIKNNVK